MSYGSIATISAVVIALILVGSVTYAPIPQIRYFEKMEIVGDGYIRITEEPSGWIIKLWLKNSGTKQTATITSIYLNDTPIPDSNYGASKIIENEIQTSIPDRINGLRFELGQTEVVSIYVSDHNYTDNSKVNFLIRLQSANGNNYIKSMHMYKSSP